MNAGPGDRWQLPELPVDMICPTESWMGVTDTGTTVISGIPLHWLAVEIHFPIGGGELVQQDTVIERMGTIITYFLPYDYCNGQVDAQEGGSFRCYEDDAVDYTVGALPCDQVTGMPERGRTPEHGAYPNPSSGSICLNVPNDFSNGIVELSDVCGRKHTWAWQTGTRCLDLSEIAPGTYHYRLVTSNGSIVQIGRWLKVD